MIRISLPQAIGRLFGALLLATAGCGGGAGSSVLVIVVDTLRADALGCYGGEASTPNLDALAARGALFTNAHSTSPLTMPSAVAMLTGVSPSVFRAGDMAGGHGLPNYHVPDAEWLLAEELAAQGYDLRMKLENPSAGLFNNFQGFAKARAFESLSAAEIAAIEEATGVRKEPRRYRDLYGFLDGLMRIDADTPFLHLYWLLDPHSPYDPPAGFRDRLRARPGQLPQPAEGYSGLKMVSAETVGGWTPREHEHLKDLYLREVESIDERIGFLLAALARSGRLAETFVVFTSDHGEAFGDHAEWGHGQDLHQSLVHVPLIVAGPGIAGGGRVTANVSHLDLVPTLAELTGVGRFRDGPGRSVAGLLLGRGRGQEERGAIYFEEGGARCRQQDGLRLGDLKLIQPKDGGPLLFDLAADPEEQRDLAAERPAEVQRLAGIVAKIRARNEQQRQAYAELLRQVEQGAVVDAETLERMRELGYVR